MNIPRTIKIYVGCALTQAPALFAESITHLKNELRRLVPDCEVFEFVGLEKGTETDVYEWDIHRCVGTCDLFVAICDFPSIGLGYEMGTAVEKQSTPTLAFAHRDSKITRLIKGINKPCYQLYRYAEIEKIIPIIERKAMQIRCEMMQEQLVFQDFLPIIQPLFTQISLWGDEGLAKAA